MLFILPDGFHAYSHIASSSPFYDRSISQIAPDLYACVPKRRWKATSIADGLHAHRWARDIHGVIGIRELG
jgi:hypothetical protein